MLEKLQTILTILNDTYPHAKIALSYGSPWELLVSVILSAQCTDIQVNKVTATLFQKYKTIEDYIKVPIEEFEKDIHSTGFFRAKAKHIQEAAVIISKQYHGIVPKTMDELLTIPGVARKTANVVLGNAYNIIEGIAVDTHVMRLSQRLRFVHLETIGGKQMVHYRSNGIQKDDYKKDADPKKIEKELMSLLPKSEWFPITYRLIDHGRALCLAKKPMCIACPLRHFCPSSRE